MLQFSNSQLAIENTTMGKFFSRFKFKEPDPTGASWGNITSFYSLLLFLIAIPFVLIVALVWLTGILGFSTWIFAGFAVLLGYAVYRSYKGWESFKQRMASQGGEFQDLVREAARSGKDMEISLLNGVLTLKYKGQGNWPEALPAPGRRELLALAPPELLEVAEAQTAAVNPLTAERMREELEGFLRLREEGVITSEEFDRIKAGLMERLSA
jgi:hypothetical protein